MGSNNNKIGRKNMLGRNNMSGIKESDERTEADHAVMDEVVHTLAKVSRHLRSSMGAHGTAHLIPAVQLEAIDELTLQVDSFDITKQKIRSENSERVIINDRTKVSDLTKINDRTKMYLSTNEDVGSGFMNNTDRAIPVITSHVINFDNELETKPLVQCDDALNDKAKNLQRNARLKNNAKVVANDKQVLNINPACVPTVNNTEGSDLASSRINDTVMLSTYNAHDTNKNLSNTKTKTNVETEVNMVIIANPCLAKSETNWTHSPEFHADSLLVAAQLIASTPLLTGLNTMQPIDETHENLVCIF